MALNGTRWGEGEGLETLSLSPFSWPRPCYLKKCTDFWHTFPLKIEQFPPSSFSVKMDSWDRNFRVWACSLFSTISSLCTPTVEKSKIHNLVDDNQTWAEGKVGCSGVLAYLYNNSISHFFWKDEPHPHKYLKVKDRQIYNISILRMLGGDNVVSRKRKCVNNAFLKELIWFPGSRYPRQRLVIQFLSQHQEHFCLQKALISVILEGQKYI